MVIHIGPASLKAALTDMTVPTLRKMMRLVGLPPPLPTRKAEIVEALRRALDDRTLRELWSRLDELQQAAVSDALHDALHHFDEHRFRARHGRLPEGYAGQIPYKLPVLRVFLYPFARYSFWPKVVPPDLAERLLEFVPPPPEPVLESTDECAEFVHRQLWPPRRQEPEFRQTPLVRRNMEVAAVHDLFTVLRLVDGGKLAVGPKTRRPAARTVELVAGWLHGGDFFESQAGESSGEAPRDRPIGHVRAFAWPWLIQAAGLAESVRGRLTLTPSGRKAITAKPGVTLRRIWKRWLANTLLDEFNRIEEVKGQFRGIGKRAMTSPRRRRQAIVAALADSPEGRWVQVDEFLRFMHATDLQFNVTRKPWRLYIVDPQHGSFGYSDGHDELETRYFLCFMFEYAATLGLVDVAFTAPEYARLDFVSRWGADYLDCLSRYDGLEFFRLTRLGAYCLGRTKRYRPPAPSAPSALTVLPDLRVRAAAMLEPPERLLLETYAVAEAEGVWRLDLDRAFSAVEGGHDPAEFRKFLAARDDQPLPEKVESFIRRIEQGASALEPGVPSLLIRCADAETADRIAGSPQTARYCVRAGPRGLVIASRSEARFRKAVHVLGYALPPRR